MGRGRWGSRKDVKEVVGEIGGKFVECGVLKVKVNSILRSREC